ncbi:MAG TPA: DUF4837 family protein [Bacteroidales bacterium]
MKKSTCLLLSVLSLATLFSCKDGSNPLLPHATGVPYELLVVMNKAQWNAPAGRTLFEILNSDVPGLPQSEPQFRLSYTPPDGFKNIYKSVRSIIIANIDPQQFTKAKMSFSRELWANGQMVLTINAPNAASFEQYVLTNEKNIIKLFVDNELGLSKKYLEKKYNKSESKRLKDHLDIQMCIPMALNKSKVSEGFFWVSNAAGKKRQDIVAYAYPYTDRETFTVDYLIRKRDSVMKANMPGGPEGSFMGTQQAWIPDSSVVTVDGKYCMELRGLWEVVGDNMGGPFVSHTQIDELNNRVITVEAFVYEPGEKKRNLMRILESALYTVKMPVKEEPQAIKNTAKVTSSDSLKQE